MPAPDLTPQTPGEPLAAISPLSSAISDANTGNPNASEGSTALAQSQPQPPLYVGKHQAGGRWIVVTNDAAADRIGDFVGDKVTILAEVERLNAGGVPYTKPAATAQSQEQGQPAVVAAQSNDLDATKLKAPVMTAEGWLCPEVAVKE